MKILILGGTRFFGREFAALRAEKGDEVCVFSRACPVPELPIAVKQIKGDRNSAAELSELARTKWDAVIDNICFSAGQAHAVAAAFHGKTGLLVFTSSGDVHLAVRGAVSPFTETQADSLPPAPGADAYGEGKREAEKIYMSAFRETGFPACAARFPIIIGPRDPKLRAYSYWLRLADGGPVIVPDGGGYYRRFLYSRDAARALDLLVENKRAAAGEIFHFGDTQAVTLKEWLSLSAWFIKPGARLIDIPFKWLLENGFEASWSPYFHPGNYALGIQKAENLLGWTSAPLREWTKDTIAWYFSRYSGGAPENYAKRALEFDIIRRYEKTQSGA